MKFRMIALMTCLALPVSCGKENPEYDLGFEEGCAAGKSDAYSCKSKNPKVGSLEEKESEYSNGFYDGYGDCYETATLLSTCNDWADEGYDSGW